MPKRRIHPPEFKAQVALDALCSKKTLMEVAASYELHPVQVCQWKQQLLKRLPDLFRKVAAGDADQGLEGLSQQLKTLTQDNSELANEIRWLKKKFYSYDQPTLRSLLEPEHPRISLRRQCDLLGVTRSGYYYRPVNVNQRTSHLARMIDLLCGEDPAISRRSLLARLADHGFLVYANNLDRLLCGLGFAPFERKLIKLLEGRLAHAPTLPVQEHEFDRDGEQWILDIAYWPAPRGVLFATLLVDAFSGRCLGWGLSDHLCSDLVTHLLGKAMEAHPLPLLLRSETLLPYLSRRCLSGLRRAGISLGEPLWMRSAQGTGRATLLAPLWKVLKQSADRLRSRHSLHSEESILHQVICEGHSFARRPSACGKVLPAWGQEGQQENQARINDLATAREKMG